MNFVNSHLEDFDFAFPPMEKNKKYFRSSTSEQKLANGLVERKTTTDDGEKETAVHTMRIGDQMVTRTKVVDKKSGKEETNTELQNLTDNDLEDFYLKFKTHGA
jgi:hypothetical protein